MDDTNDLAIARDVTAVIAAWLEHERQRASVAARDQGVPASVSVVQWYGQRNEHGGFKGEQRQRQMSPIAVGGRPLLDALMVPPFDADGLECAAELHEAYEGECFFFSPFVAESFERAPELWVQNALLEPLRHQYLESITTLDVADSLKAGALATDTVRLMESDEATLVTMLPIGGIAPDGGNIGLDDVRIRQLTAEEIGAQLAAMAGRHTRSRHRTLWVWHDRGAVTTAVLEVREPGPTVNVSVVRGPNRLMPILCVAGA